MEEVRKRSGFAWHAKSLTNEGLASGALLVAALLFVLPFLHPHHQAPIVTFYQEWLAALLCIFAAVLVVLAAGRQALTPPGLAWVPLALIGLVATQVLVGRTASSHHATLYVGYLVLATVSLALGRWFRQALGFNRCTLAFASACFAGGLATTFIAVLQLHGIGVEYGLVAPNLGRMTANLAQANQFTAYIWLATISAMYLGLQRTIRPAIAAAAVCVMLFVTFLSGSRSNIVYAFLLAALCEIAIWRGVIRRADRRYSTLVCICYIVLFFVMPGWLRELGLYSGYTATERTAEELSGSSQRFWIWWLGWQAFASAPALGVGVGSIPTFAYAISPWGPSGYDEYVPEHAHNLFLHLAAELGFMAPLIAAVGLVVWLAGLRRQSHEKEHIWLLGFLGILFIYSNLEYPLWFAYFLVPATLLLGLGATPVSTSWFSVRLAPAMAMLVLLLGSGLVAMYIHHVGLERVVLYLQFQGVSGYRLTLDGGAKSTVEDVPGWSPLGHYVEFIGIMTAPVERSSGPAEVVARCDRVLRMAPGYLSAKKCTMLFALNGEIEKARYHLKQTAAAYPGRQKDLASSLRELAEDEPAVALLAREFEQSIATRMDAKLFGALN